MFSDLSFWLIDCILNSQLFEYKASTQVHGLWKQSVETTKSSLCMQI